MYGYDHEFGRDIRFAPRVPEFCKVLDREMLAAYWRENADAIKAQDFQMRDKVINQGNYTASYREDLEDVFTELDSLVTPSEEDNGASPDGASD